MQVILDFVFFCEEVHQGRVGMNCYGSDGINFSSFTSCYIEDNLRARIRSRLAEFSLTCRFYRSDTLASPAILLSFSEGDIQ